MWSPLSRPALSISPFALITVETRLGLIEFQQNHIEKFKENSKATKRLGEKIDLRNICFLYRMQLLLMLWIVCEMSERAL